MWTKVGTPANYTRCGVHAAIKETEEKGILAVKC